MYSTDLVNHILKKDFEVTVLTGLPFYPWWKTPLEYSHITPGKKFIDSVEVVRIFHKISSKGGLTARLMLEVSFWRYGKQALKEILFKKFDLTVAIIPSVSAGLLARRVALKQKIPGLLVVQDISSLATLQSGMPGAPLFYGIATFLEKRASRWANSVIAVSEPMSQALRKILKNHQVVNVVNNYSISKVSQENSMLDAELICKVKTAFYVIHTGNIGYKQDLMNVVRAAALLEFHEDVQFLILGHGNQELMIKNAVKDMSNIRLLPFVSENSYQNLLRAAGTLLINERATLREMSLPSKLTSYLASGTPVIAAVSKDGATAKFLDDAALLVQPGDPAELAKKILSLKNDIDLQKKLGQKGKLFTQVKLDAKKGREEYSKIISGLLEKGIVARNR